MVNGLPVPVVEFKLFFQVTFSHSLGMLRTFCEFSQFQIFLVTLMVSVLTEVIGKSLMLEHDGLLEGLKEKMVSDSDLEYARLS
jgi:hypothetical protein